MVAGAVVAGPGAAVVVGVARTTGVAVVGVGVARTAGAAAVGGAVTVGAATGCANAVAAPWAVVAR